MSLHKAAGLLVAAGLMIGLIGAGVSATFTDTATATMTVHVGTFDIQIVDGTGAPGSISCPAATLDSCTITYNAPDILGSAPGSLPFSFTIKNTGSIVALVTVTASTPAAPFSDLLGAGGAQASIAAGATHVYAAGLQWTELGNPNQGQSVSIVYSISAVDHN